MDFAKPVFVELAASRNQPVLMPPTIFCSSKTNGDEEIKSSNLKHGYVIHPEMSHPFKQNANVSWPEASHLVQTHAAWIRFLWANGKFQQQVSSRPFIEPPTKFEASIISDMLWNTNGNFWAGWHRTITETSSSNQI